MKSKQQLGLLVMTALFLSACGSQVAVPPTSDQSAQPAVAVRSAPPAADTALDPSTMPKALSLSVGESLQVPVTISGQVPAAGLLSWQSSDPRIVAVTASGLLSAYQPGAVQVRIVQKDHPERNYVLEVTVQAPPIVMPKPPAQPITPAPVAPPTPTPPAPAPTPTPTPAPTPPAPAPAPTPVAPPAPAPTPPAPAPTPTPIAPPPVPAPIPTPAPAPTPTSGFTSEVLRLVNVARAAGGSCGGVAYPPAAALSWNTLLAGAAQAHAADMATKNYFDHTSPDGRTFDQRITAAGYQWRSVAENIAAGQQTPADVMASWLSSPGHCKNIFNPILKELGVGYFEGGSYKQYWVQDFGTPR
ncbi:CAP domain-containing protein [Deinococcus psychrotolerans]|nr:CAP domain-containing protein [Deinococcus psychrotolerans]